LLEQERDGQTMSQTALQQRAAAAAARVAVLEAELQTSQGASVVFLLRFLLFCLYLSCCHRFSYGCVQPLSLRHRLSWRRRALDYRTHSLPSMNSKHSAIHSAIAFRVQRCHSSLSLALFCFLQHMNMLGIIVTLHGVCLTCRWMVGREKIHGGKVCRTGASSARRAHCTGRRRGAAPPICDAGTITCPFMDDMFSRRIKTT
jgi:hypothetical protein